MWKMRNRGKCQGTFRVGDDWKCIAPGATLMVEAEPKYCSVGVSWVKMLERAGSTRTAKVPVLSRSTPVSASSPGTLSGGGGIKPAPIDQSMPLPYGGRGGRNKKRGRR